MALVVMINETDIMIHGKVITSIEDVLNTNSNASDLLTTALQAERGKTRRQGKNGKPVRHEATIMGDRDIPYKILKQVMASCTEAGFERISLAVLQKPLQGG
jgi:biopolymer transport protein TolR